MCILHNLTARRGVMPVSGIEPGPLAWETSVLTTKPLTPQSWVIVKIMPAK